MWLSPGVWHKANGSKHKYVLEIASMRLPVRWPREYKRVFRTSGKRAGGLAQGTRAKGASAERHAAASAESAGD